MAQLNVKPLEAGGYQLSGQLVHQTVAKSAELEDILSSNSLNQANQQVVKFDLAELNKVDTAGLAWLIFAVSKLTPHQKKLELQNPPQQLKNLIDLSQVSSLFIC